MSIGENTFHKIKKILTDSPPNRLSSTILKHSAVIILLYNYSDSYNLILTERTRIMKHHSGEISFPGGRHEPDKDKNLIETALRECHEEIGISRDQIEILGQLDDFPTMTGYIITPVVGKIKTVHPQFTRNDIEVEKIFTIPIEFFLNPQNFREQTMKVKGGKFPIFMFDYEHKSKTYTIWGATAHILVEYLKKIHHYNPSHLFTKRFSMHKIEEVVKQRRMNSFSKEKNKKIKTIIESGEDIDAARKTEN